MPDRIPEHFLGRWTGENHACESSSPDVNVMYIEPRKAIFWNSVAHFLDVTVLDESQVLLVLEYKEHEYSVGSIHESEPGAEPMEMVLRLSDDRDMLASIVSGRAMEVRHRCPATPEVGNSPG